MKRLANILITFVVVCGAFILLAAVSSYWQQNFRREIVERLADPIYPISIRKDGLVDPTGKVIMPARISSIPPLPDLIVRDLYKYGIEVRKDGTCVGLVQVHHWCGNDPVGFQLARVDIASLCVAVDNGLIRCTPYGVEPGSYSMLRLPVEDLQMIKE